MMKNKVALGLFFLLYVSTSYAVKFHSYVNDKGETVFSNIPQKCVQGATLTCLDRHPVLSSKGSASHDTKKSATATGLANKESRQSNNRTIDKSHTGAPTNAGSVNSAFNILDNIVEMNNLMNEYYPASADPEEVAKVRAQQDDILDVLQIIKGASNNEEQGTIEKAIDVLRSNLVQ